MKVLVEIFMIVCILFEFNEATCPPLQLKKGVQLKCEVKGSKTAVDCTSEVPNDTDAFYQCQKNYENEFGDRTGGKLVCNAQGRWLKLTEYQDFICMPECGQARNSSLTTLSSFIEREYETGDEIFPWHVAIFRRFGEANSYKYSCGGTLINPDNKGFIVLTAAHCLTKSSLSVETAALNSFRIVLGPVSTDFRGNVAGDSQIFMPKKIITDKEYDPSSLQSDIGMIELSGPVKVSDTVLPACFPTRKIANAQVRPGVLGEVPIIKNDQLTYQDILKIPVAEQGDCIRDCAREPTITEFCASHNAGTSLTGLDSGSGLVFHELTENPKRYYLQGILTKVVGDSEGCASHDTFTSVSVFLDWVSRVHEQFADSQTFNEVVAFPPSTPPFKNNQETSNARPGSTSSPSIFQNDFSRIGLDLHNFFRQRHHSPPLQLNGKLSKEAQDWAEYLVRENKWEFSVGKDYSENIFQYFGKISSNDVLRKAVNNWYDASQKYNWKNPEASTFSQVVWKGTTHIGIGVASRGGKSVVVTNYWPKGNIYNIGDGDRAKYFKENVLPLPFNAITNNEQNNFRN